jgi:Fic family protein
MDDRAFTDRKTGQLVRINRPEPDWAFVPDPLPPQWEMPPDLLEMSFHAVERLGTLNGVASRFKNPQLLLRPLQDREALQSSKLEGTFSTPEKLLLFAQNPTETGAADDDASAREVFNYGMALRIGYDLLKTMPMCQRVIREMHGQLMMNVRGREKTPGEFRRTQNAIGDGIDEPRFIPPPPQFLSAQLANLESYLNSPRKMCDVLARVFIAHYQFEAIHPFGDGNGRVGRAVLALSIYKEFNHYLPWLYLSPYFEKDKNKYVEKMFRISTHGEWSEWVKYCLEGTIEQANDAIKRCQMLHQLRENYSERIQQHATKRTADLVDRLFVQPVVRVVDLKKAWTIDYKTAKKDIECLGKAGILRRLEDQSPAAYYAWEIFRIAYRENPSLATANEVQYAATSFASTESEQPSSQSQTAPVGSDSPHEPDRP